MFPLHAHPEPDALLDGLDPEQRSVAVTLRGPVRVLAGAGTGKTRAITHRIAHGVASGVYVPSEVLAVTFTTRAAGEMRTRLRALGAGGVQARTFHSAALRQLRYFWPHVYGGEPPQLTESKLAMMAQAARANRVQVDQATLRDLASEVEWSKVSNVRPDDYEKAAEARGREVTGISPALVSRVFAAYEEVKRGQGRMDMEDVLLVAAALLEDERVGAQVRRQYKWFVVDEFQDVSPIQWALLELWLGGRDELCVVGDPAQTIYSFAGARADYLRDFPSRFRETTTLSLVRNYRSTPEVVAAANAVLGTGADRGGAVELRAQRPSGEAVTYTEHSDEVAEAEAVAAEILALHRAGTPLREVAILFRINAQSEAFEEALAARGLAYVVRGAARFFERAEVRKAVTLLRGRARGGEPVAPADLVAEVKAVLAGMEWTEEAPAGRGTRRDRWESLQALVTQAEEWAVSPLLAVGGPGGGADGEVPSALNSFVDELDRRASEQHAPVAEGVTLATLHAAKGLEWDAVFLCGMQEGSMPIVYAEGPEAIAEERRLLYVGMTRARLRLGVSWSQSRSPGGRATRKPSRFLAEVRPEVASDRAGGPRKRKGIATCRSCGAPLSTTAERKVGRCEDCPATYDEELFERLRVWRLERAGVDKVPAYVVFTDLTLQAIAEHRPTDVRGLLKINGVGRSKVDKYADEVLEILDRERPKK
ncbi:MAG: ATP-dependent DNA helicase UvrD2 [Nocardioides sp.]|nr:ATP-dependent DNA helicase UvrD2 [Nocardioides sp.]